MVKLQFTVTRHDVKNYGVRMFLPVARTSNSASKISQTSTARHLPLTIETVKPSLACSAIYEGFTALYSGET